jgi:amidohydrolase
MDLVKEAKELFSYTQAVRRRLHQHPELAFKEYKTAELIAQELSKLGLEVTTGIAETGLVGLIEGDKPGPTILLRFDMDALPILEQNKTEYASQISGYMHACGHDGHVAIGLTVAKLLTDHRSEIFGNIKLLFQPAEEGAGGADAVIAAGALTQPTPEACYGLHVWNENPVGWLGIASGPVMAAASTFDIEIKGKGGHGAIPHLAADPIIAMANIINASQSIVSRNVNPQDACVVSFCAVNGGDAFNVIPDSVKMKGTIRSFNEQVSHLAQERLTTIAESIAAGLNCAAEVRISNITFPVVNDPFTTEFAQRSATKLFPTMEVETKGFTTMGAEDFASYQKQIPGTFFFIGSKNPEKGLDFGHHHPRFDFDEEALYIGAALMAQTALDYRSRV